jgi:hypothetical protein
MEKVVIKLMLAAVVIVFMTPAAHSELIVYEPFDYIAGDLVGKGGAFGLSTDWVDWGLGEDSQVVLGNLEHPDYEDLVLDASGNHAEIIGDVGFDFLPALEANISGGFPDGVSFWFSFLYQTIDVDAIKDDTFFNFLFPDTSGGTATVGIEINGGVPAMYTVYDPWVVVSGAPDEGTVMWVVIKAETNASTATTEKTYMWIDPDPSVEPDIENAGGSVEYLIGNRDTTEYFNPGGLCTFAIDEIKIGTSFDDVTATPPCENASNPDPENAESLVDIDLPKLHWDAPTCATSPTYDIYFDPNFIFTSPVATGTTEPNFYIVSPLEYDTTYYWRVDVTEATVLYEGRVWNFTTWPETPVFTTQPESTTVAAGSEVQFSIEAVNVTVGYEWYVSATLDGVGSPIPSSDSTVLNLTDVELADEGYYYCKATNSLGSSESERARLLTERLLAHWKFEDNLNDANDPLNNGSPVTSIDYADGIDGRAISITDPNAFFTTTNDLGELTEITVSVWINPNTLDVAEQAILAAGGTWDTGTVYINVANENIYGEITEDPDETLNVGPALLTQGAWNHCVFVYDTSTSSSAMYLNGEVTAEDVVSVAPILPPLSIGGISMFNGIYFDGLIDDLRIYDYRLSDLQIASLYVDFVPEADVCIANPTIGYDLNEDCAVDLADLLLVVSQWCDCNIVPTCLP